MESLKIVNTIFQLLPGFVAMEIIYIFTFYLKPPPFERIVQAYDYSAIKPDYNVFGKRIERILKIGSQRRLDKSIHKITEQSLKKVLGEPDGRVITHHDVCLLVDEIMKGLTPIIANSVLRDKRVR